MSEALSKMKKLLNEANDRLLSESEINEIADLMGEVLHQVVDDISNKQYRKALYILKDLKEAINQYFDSAITASQNLVDTTPVSLNVVVCINSLAFRFSMTGALMTGVLFVIEHLIIKLRRLANEQQ